MPKVSVISGFYNRGAVLERTVLSILSQTYEDFELIVFDDASTDDTSVRMDQLSERLKDSRLRFIRHNANKGFVRGLVDAITESSGEYIAIQGSGDASLPNRLALQVALLDARPDVGVVGGWYYNVQEGNGASRLRQPNADSMTYSDWLQGNAFSHGEVMIRRSALTMAGGYRTEFTFGQDYDLWLRIAKKHATATIPEPLYLRYVQTDGVSYDPKKITRQSSFNVAARIIAQAPPQEARELLAKVGTNGPLSVAPAEHPAVQKMIVWASLRMIFYGTPEGGVDVARDCVKSQPKRAILIALGTLYQKKIFSPIRRLADRALKIK